MELKNNISVEYLCMIIFILLFNSVFFISFGFCALIDPDKDAMELSRILTKRNTDIKPITCLEMIKPEDFGLEVRRGQIDYTRITKEQKDTIVIAMFNPEDNYLDIAVFYKSKNEIVIYINQGNGCLAEYNHIQYKSENVERIEAFLDKKPGDCVPPFLKCSLKVVYSDKSYRTITNDMINGRNMLESGCDNAFFRMFDFPRNSINSLGFIQIWSHSENTNVASFHAAVGDIDGDGKTEIVYSYFLSNQPPYPAKVIVFKSLGNSQFVVEWDSLFTNGAWVLSGQITDFDDNGFKEVAVEAYFPLAGKVCTGFLEKNSSGIYKYCFAGFGDYYSINSIEYKETMVLDTLVNKGMWICSSTSDPNATYKTEIYRTVYNGHRNYMAFGFLGDGYYIDLPETVYDMKVFDIDGDGKEEIVIGDVQFGSNFFSYLDSTGVNTNHGYEGRFFEPSEPVSAGYLFPKDYDNDGIKEFYLAGPGNNTGSIGVVKHAGAPGANNFSVVWWDTISIMSMPINGMDSGYVDCVYSFVHPAFRTMPGSYERSHLYIFSRAGLYNFKKTYYEFRDSLTILNPYLYDVENSGRAFITAPVFHGYYGGIDRRINIYKQTGSIGISNINTNISNNYKLLQNYPNPFNPATTIKYAIPKDGFVEIKVYDMTGREITKLVNEVKPAGYHKVLFNASNLASGIYFYRIQSGNFTQTKKMILIK